MNGAKTLRGGARAIIIIAIIIVIVIIILGNFIIRLSPISIEAGLTYFLVLCALQSKQALLKPAEPNMQSRLGNHPTGRCPKAGQLKSLVRGAYLCDLVAMVVRLQAPLPFSERLDLGDLVHLLRHRLH
jgi:hypothetical protein